jgi:hypothetical protein
LPLHTEENFCKKEEGKNKKDKKNEWKGREIVTKNGSS